VYHGGKAALTARALIKPRRTAPAASGVLVDVTPRKAGWEFVHFSVRRIAQGQRLALPTRDEECALVLLSGAGEISIDGGQSKGIGPRVSVFDSYPHAVYLPDGHEAVLRACVCGYVPAPAHASITLW